MKEIIRKFIRKRNDKSIIYNISRLIWLGFLQIIKREYLRLERYSLKTEFTKSSFKKNRFFTTYNNVIIEGKTRLILKGDQALLGHIFNDNNTNVLRTYYLLEELNGHFKVTKDFKGIEIKAHYINNLLDLNGLWLHLISPSSDNYMHFISELAPQLISFIENNKELHFGIIVDENLPKQILEFINLVACNIPRIAISPAQRLKVEKLAIINKQGYCFAWGRKSSDILMSYNFIKEDLINLRSYIFSRYKPVRTYRDKLFLKRNSDFRNLLNEEELCNAASKKNFFSISPVLISFCEQINYFNSASTIVCQGGASLANIIFMKPGTKVICIVIEHDYIDYDYFRIYGSIFNVSVEYLYGTYDAKKYSNNMIYSREHFYNADFVLDEGLFLKALSSI